MNGLLIAFHNASMVQYTSLMDEKKYDKVSNQVYSIHKLTLLAGLFLILFSVDLGTLLAAKASFRNSLTIVPIIVGGYIFYGVALLYSRVFNYKKINIYLTVILLIAAAVNILLNMKYIPIYGYKAAAYTTLFSYFLMAVISWFVCSFLLKMPKLPLLKIVLSSLPIIMVGLLFYYFKWESKGMDIPIIGMKLLLFTITAIVLFYETINRLLNRKNS
jgi:O-antigen/teichoic acid export membrane protein